MSSSRAAAPRLHCARSPPPSATRPRATGARRQNLLHAMQDLEETLQNVRETTEIIRDNPAILIRGSTSGANQ